MSARVLQGILTFLVVTGLFSVGYLPTHNRAQASTLETNLGINAPTDVIGVIFTQPVDPSGKLYLSAFLDPDGSDFDQIIWDSFTLTTTETITYIAWIGGFDPLKSGKGGPVGDFKVAVFPSIKLAFS